MKKFLFAGEWYYPSGGILDFIMVGTEQECLTKYHQNNWDWGQIIDPTTMKQEIDLSFGDDDTIEVRKMVDGKIVEGSLETISLTPDLSEIQKAVELGLVLQTSHTAYTRLYNKEESL